MQTFFLSVVSISFGVILPVLLLLIVQKSIKRQFGAKWIRLVWIAVLVRLLCPFSFTGVSLISPALFGSVRVLDAVSTDAGSFWQSVSLLNLLTLIWLAVAGVLLLYHLLDYILFRRHLLRWSREPEQMAVLEMAELVRRFWKLPRSLKILICPELKTPAAVGFVSPVILLPTEHFDDTDLELILHHEAAHLRRGDIIIKWCSMAVKCIYWFHPLVYLLCSQLENDLEAACDAAVMDKIGQEQEMQKYYSYLILDIAAGKSGRFYPFTTCLQDTKECLRARIDNIFDTRPKRSGLPVLVLCSICLVMSSGLVQLQYQDGTMTQLPAAEPETTVVTENSGDQSVVTIDLYQLEQQLEEQES